MLKAVIFDFDGVIVDSEPLHFEAFNALLAESDLSVGWDEYYEKYLGYTDRECLAAISEDHGLGFDEAKIAELVERKGEYFERIAGEKCSVLDGVGDFLSRLKEYGCRIGICSGALLCDIELMLRGTGLHDYFKVIVAADDVLHGKPDPEGFLQALSKLNLLEGGHIDAGECLVVEDSHWGLDAARSAGMKTLAVTNTYPREDLGGADIVCDNLGGVELSEILRIF